MKRILLTIALCAASGYACAQDTLAPVIVEHVDSQRLIENCTPPAGAPECAAFHALIRQNFSEREIGMLFGAATAYPEYRTSYDSVRERYENLLRYIDDYGMPVTYPPLGIIERPPAAVAYYPPAPDDQTLIISDDNAVIRSDDPDSHVLSRLPPLVHDDDEDFDDDDVVYYDDEDSLPEPEGN